MNRTTPKRQALLMIAAAFLCSSAALAQLGSGVSASRDGKLAPPTPTFRTETGGEIMPIVWTVVLVVVGVGVNLIPTKRGHQD